jgi:hypothetical protein
VSNTILITTGDKHLFCIERPASDRRAVATDLRGFDSRDKGGLVLMAALAAILDLVLRVVGQPYSPTGVGWGPNRNTSLNRALGQISKTFSFSRL